MTAPLLLALLTTLAGCANPPTAEPTAAATAAAESHFEVSLTDEEWKARLDPEEYRILRQAGTERAFTGKYWDNHAHGVYKCAGCGQVVFRAGDKFESGTGWPSYTRPAAEGAVHAESDRSYGITRTEVLCGRCGGHLGHVFRDGPPPTGLRYCINGNALDFEADGT